MRKTLQGVLYVPVKTDVNDIRDVVVILLEKDDEVIIQDGNNNW